MQEDKNSCFECDQQAPNKPYLELCAGVKIFLCEECFSDIDEKAVETKLRARLRMKTLYPPLCDALASTLSRIIDEEENSWWWYVEDYPSSYSEEEWKALSSEEARKYMWDKHRYWLDCASTRLLVTPSDT